jgi:ssDNA-binding Zn-finger/Zn-ribbon topoisomerase 1
MKKLATQWRCPICNYIHASEKEPEKCPACMDGEGKPLVYKNRGEAAMGSGDMAEMTAIYQELKESK